MLASGQVTARAAAAGHNWTGGSLLLRASKATSWLGKVKAAEVSLHHPLRGCCKERGAHVADHVHVYGVEWMAFLVDLVITEADLEYVIGSMSATPA